MTRPPLPPVDPISLAIVNARVRTGDPKRPWADGVAVRGDRIAAVGSSAEVKKMVSAGTQVIDARGQLLVAGVHESPARSLEHAGQRIARGERADLTLIDRDITRLAPERLSEAVVMVTIVGGEVRYERAAER